MAEDSFHTNLVTARGHRVPEHLLKTEELVIKPVNTTVQVIHPEDESGKWQAVEDEELIEHPFLNASVEKIK